MLTIKGSIEYISSCMYLLPMAIGTFNNMAINLARSIFFFKQKTAYEILGCDWSSDVCSSDLHR